MTIEKMEWHEIVSETMKLLQSLNAQEKEMSVAAIAAGCGMAVVKKPTGNAGGYRPIPRGKTKAW